MKKTEEIGSIYNPYNLIDNPTVYKGGIIIQGVELLPIKKYGILTEQSSATSTEHSPKHRSKLSKKCP